MLLKPTSETYRVIGFYTGKVIVGVGILMLMPLLTAAAYGEWEPFFDFLMAGALSLIIGIGAQVFFKTNKDLTWGEGLVVSAGSWIWAVGISALPMWLSGHFGSFLDAVFEAMSGYTTTGLTLLQDLDHASLALNMWRHVICFAGGQGIVIIALTLLFKGTAGAYKMYVGEGRDERVMPNVIQSARAIWLVSLVYMFIYTTVLTLINLSNGFAPDRAFLFGLWAFMGSWATGGFAPMSYNAIYYHSFGYEIVTIILMVTGAMNFALHWSVWSGKRKELFKNIELRSFAITLTLGTLLALYGLARVGIYSDALTMARKAIYLMVSGHTATGLSTVFGKTLVTQWGTIGMVAIILVMMLGGSASSTAGGIKGLRVGIIAKTIITDIKRLILPERATTRIRIHHMKDSFIDDRTIRSVYGITVLFLVTYISSGVLGVIFGYDFQQAMFEGVSAISGSGLSCGVTDPSMPSTMKVIYTLYMWVGRLEFLSVFAVGAHLVSVFRGR